LDNRGRRAQAKGYQIDYDDWHANVHGVLPYDRCLGQDERLRAIIKVGQGEGYGQG